MLKEIQQGNLKTNFYIANPDESHIEQIKKIYNQNRDTLGIPFSRVFDEMLVDPNFLVLLTDQNTVAGFCGFKYRPRKNYYEIEHLCIDVPYRRKGLAIKLLQFQLNFNYVVNCPRSLLYLQSVPVVAYAVDGKDNNIFYNNISKKFDIVPKKTKILRKYYLDVDRILKYGS